MANISNWTSEDNPRWPSAQVSRLRLPAGAAVMDRPGGRPAKSRVRESFALAVSVALDWLAYFLRLWGDRWFAMNDTEAHWRGWQITKALSGLGRHYRDTRFETLAACARYGGAEIWSDAPRGPCPGTGRSSLGEVT